MIDIGVNLTHSRFDSDRVEVIGRAAAAGVSTLILTGTNVDASAAAVELARTYGGGPCALYTTAGIHPHDAAGCDKVSLQHLKTLVTDHRDKVVAVGETGLDFNRNFSSPAAQITAFERQIELAIALGLPLFLHERDAHQRQLEVLSDYGRDLPRAVIHCFTGTRGQLESYLDLGLWIGITGWICDERRGGELQAALEHIPADRLMVETDAPYLLPRTLKPRPKNNRNEPSYLKEVVAMIAHCRNETTADVALRSADNARRFFGIGSASGDAQSTGHR